MRYGSSWLITRKMTLVTLSIHTQKYIGRLVGSPRNQREGLQMGGDQRELRGENHSPGHTTIAILTLLPSSLVTECTPDGPGVSVRILTGKRWHTQSFY